MHPLIRDQLNRLHQQDVSFTMYGESQDNIAYIDFPKKQLMTKDSDKVTQNRYTFEDYIVKPFEKFDWHKKHKQEPPPQKIMYGVTVQELPTRIQIKVLSYDGMESWFGWIPRKSVTIEQSYSNK